MSLKNFHIFFIMISVVIAMGFGLWCFFTEAGAMHPASTVMGTLALLAVPCLLVYAWRFLRKLEHEGIR